MQRESVATLHSHLMSEIAANHPLEGVVGTLTKSVLALKEVDQCWLGRPVWGREGALRGIQLLSMASSECVSKRRTLAVSGQIPCATDRDSRTLFSFDTSSDRRPWLAMLGDATAMSAVLVAASPSLERPEVLLGVGRAIPCTFPPGHEADLRLLADVSAVALLAYGHRETLAPKGSEKEDAVAPAASAASAGGAGEVMSSRDRQVLALLVRGYACKEVAAMLGLSHRTIEHYVERLKSRFQQARLHGLVAYAIREGLCVGTEF